MNAEATELKIYAENESALYPQKQSIEKNLSLKAYKGVFEVKKAAKLWRYWVDEAAKRYAREFKGNSATMFPGPCRNQVAEVLAQEFYAEWKLGEHDKYKPKAGAKKATKR